mgnify:CR=1 FL=1|jgi:tRNA U34 5-methylaminomethyl-2-thiouridine-forming methyltransferase MnmC
MKSPELIVTGDGSHSLLNPQLNETYHSVHGAVRESRHVFIQEGLAYWTERNAGSVSILEIGFGTGLNALLALEFSQNTEREIYYHTLEAYPLESTVYSQLNYGEKIMGREWLTRLHEAPWGTRHAMTERFTIKKDKERLQDLEIDAAGYDLVFFDAFAPSRQPEMWELPVLQKVVAGLRPSGVFVTYCARGQVKRDLRGLGLVLETLPGPPGKKEMIRAIADFTKSPDSL